MKSIAEAQEWIVKSSLISSGCLILFFLLAPSLLAFPLDSSQSRHVIQLVIPPFFGYLTMAVRSVLADEKATSLLDTETPRLFPLLLKGTFVLYLVIIVAALVAFFVSTSTLFAANRGITNIHFEDLSWAICAALSLQASTFCLLVAFVFKEKLSVVRLDAGESK